MLLGDVQKGTVPLLIPLLTMLAVSQSLMKGMTDTAINKLNGGVFFGQSQILLLLVLVIRVVNKPTLRRHLNHPVSEVRWYSSLHRTLSQLLNQ